MDKNLQPIFWLFTELNIPVTPGTHSLTLPSHNLPVPAFSLWYFPLKLASCYFWEEVLGFPIFLVLFSWTRVPHSRTCLQSHNWSSQPNLSLFLIFAALNILLLCTSVATAPLCLNFSHLCACLISQIWEEAWYGGENKSYDVGKI